MFGNTKILDIKELTEGYFNVAYLADLENGKSVIIKVAPASETIIIGERKD